MPAIREWKGSQGNFVMSDSSRLVVSEESLKETADMIAFYFEEMLQKDIEVVVGAPQNGDFYFSLAADQAELGEEGLDITQQEQAVKWAEELEEAINGLEKKPEEKPDQSDKPETGNTCITILKKVVEAVIKTVVTVVQKLFGRWF